VFPLLVAAIGGGLVTAAATAPFGAILSVLSAPFGGSLCAALVAVQLARRRGADWHSQSDLDDQTDAMVAALRGVTAQAEQSGESDRSAGGASKPSTGDVRAA
jgi:hypothetical protein